MKLDVPAYRLRRGNGALLVSMPHVGIYMPDWLKDRVTGCGLGMVDTDWHLDTLYDFLEDLDATVICATHSRYVVDLNRPPNDASLYPGKNTTGLCPAESFNGDPLYQSGMEPDGEEVSMRREVYWKPYHDAIEAELNRLREHHGHVLLFDAHSIHSRVPGLFDGLLPQINIGTNDNRSCAPGMASCVEAYLASQSSYSWVLNGRFKGGYITRHYGNPDAGVHAVQMEMAMRCYMNEDHPSAMDPSLLPGVREFLRSLLLKMLDWQKGSSGHRGSRSTNIAS